MAELTGGRVAECIRDGSIEIDPYDESLVNQNSLDLRLGNLVTVYERFAVIDRDGKTHKSTEWIPEGRLIIDVRREERVAPPYEIGSDGFLLEPGVLYLMHTHEHVLAKNYRPQIEGKSSIARLGVFVHITAGKGETGFNGQYTLEVLATYPTLVIAGMRFCQISFLTLEGEVEDYQKRGNYTQGALSTGPVPSRIWKQFVK